MIRSILRVLIRSTMLGRPSFTLKTGSASMPAASSAAAVPRVASKRNPRASRSFPRWATLPLVTVIDAQEYSSLLRKTLAGRKLRLRERLAVRSRDAHHFAGRAHLRPQNRVHPAKFVEREQWRLHRIEFVNGYLRNAVMFYHRQFHIGKAFSSHQPRRDFCQRHTRRFAHVRNGARSPGG